MEALARDAVDLARRGLSDSGVAKVVRKLGSHVTSLDLTANNIGVAGARELGGFLAEERCRLRELVLSENHIGDAGVGRIMEGLRVNRTVEIVDLRYNSVTHVGAVSVGNMLRENAVLRELDLELNAIGKGGAASIARALEGNTALHTLKLGYNNIGDQGALPFASLLRRRGGGLARLHLGNNNLSPATAGRLREAAPEGMQLDLGKETPMDSPPSKRSGYAPPRRGSFSDRNSSAPPKSLSSTPPTQSTSGRFNALRDEAPYLGDDADSIDHLSLEFASSHRLRPEQKLQDGFYMTSPAGGKLVVDPSIDPVLRTILQQAGMLIAPIFDIRTKVQSLALLVCCYTGGAEEMPKIQHHATNVPLSEGGTGVRAVLMKYVCDRLGVGCSLEGTLESSLWNTVGLGLVKEYVVDLGGSPGAMYESDGEPAQRYITNSPLGETASAVQPIPINSTRYFALPDSRMALKKHGKLGGGATGSVFRCTIGGVTFAMKKVLIGGAFEKRIKEIVILEQLDHDNVVKYLGHEMLGEQEVGIFMEYLPWSLHSWMRKLRADGAKCFKERDINVVALEVLKGLHYLHEKAPMQIVHRDLKSKNILLDVDADDEIREVKLCDFGVSKIVTAQTCADTMVGTYYWMAPEILRNDQSSYTTKADVWSYGMVLVEMLTLRNPYHENAQDWGVTKRMILRGQPPAYPSHLAPPKIQEVVSQCLQLHPASRPTTRDIMIYLISQ